MALVNPKEASSLCNEIGKIKGSKSNNKEPIEKSLWEENST
jgi:hypothetical protein